MCICVCVCGHSRRMHDIEPYDVMRYDMVQRIAVRYDTPLDVACCDAARHLRQWLKRDIWISRDGSLCYFSVTTSRCIPATAQSLHTMPATYPDLPPCTLVNLLIPPHAADFSTNNFPTNNFQGLSFQDVLLSEAVCRVMTRTWPGAGSNS